MSELSKALDQSQRLAADRRRGARRVPGLLLLRKTSKRRPFLLLLAACACLTAVGSIWIPAKAPVPAPAFSTPPETAAKPDPALAEALDKLIVKVLVSGPFPRVLTTNGQCVASQELLPGLYLFKIENTTLVAIDENGAIYHKKF